MRKGKFRHGLYVAEAEAQMAMKSSYANQVCRSIFSSSSSFSTAKQQFNRLCPFTLSANATI